MQYNSFMHDRLKYLLIFLSTAETNDLNIRDHPNPQQGILFEGDFGFFNKPELFA
jgi:hypothetical protein